MVLRFVIQIFCVAAVALWSASSWAQGNLSPSKNVLSDVGAHPIHIGSFLVYPKLNFEQRYDDNIYASEADEQSDLSSTVNPGIVIKKNIRDHEFSLETSGEIIRYWDKESENIENLRNALTGKLIAHRSVKIPFEISYDIDHKQRTIERTINKAREPIKFYSFKSEVGIEYQPNRLLFGLYTGYGNKRFNNGVSVGGAPLIRQDADYDSFSMKGIIRYTTPAEWSPFVSVQAAHNDFQRRSYNGTGFNGLARDNTVIRALAGTGFNYKGLITGEIAFGRDWRKYQEEAIDDISAPSAEASVVWKPLERASLSFNLLRQTEEDNIINRGYVQTMGSATLDYELQRDLFLKLFGEKENVEFEEISREDDTYSGSLGLYYVINPRVQIGGEFVHRWRDSTQDGSSFEDNVFIGRINTSF